MANLEKIATALEVMAEYVEQTEREKQAQADASRQARLDKIAATHLAAHGEELPEAARQKLAQTDLSTLDLVDELLAKQAGALEPMGAPAQDESPSPITTKEAAAAADQRFVNWIVS